MDEFEYAKLRDSPQDKENFDLKRKRTSILVPAGNRAPLTELSLNYPDRKARRVSFAPTAQIRVYACLSDEEEECEQTDPYRLDDSMREDSIELAFKRQPTRFELPDLDPSANDTTNTILSLGSLISPHMSENAKYVDEEVSKKATEMYFDHVQSNSLENDDMTLTIVQHAPIPQIVDTPNHFREEKEEEDDDMILTFQLKNSDNRRESMMTMDLTSVLPPNIKTSVAAASTLVSVNDAVRDSSDALSNDNNDIMNLESIENTGSTTTMDMEMTRVLPMILTATNENSENVTKTQDESSSHMEEEEKEKHVKSLPQIVENAENITIHERDDSEMELTHIQQNVPATAERIVKDSQNMHYVNQSKENIDDVVNTTEDGMEMDLSQGRVAMNEEIAKESAEGDIVPLRLEEFLQFVSMTFMPSQDDARPSILPTKRNIDMNNGFAVLQAYCIDVPVIETLEKSKGLYKSWLVEMQQRIASAERWFQDHSVGLFEEALYEECGTKIGRWNTATRAWSRMTALMQWKDFQEHSLKQLGNILQGMTVKAQENLGEVTRVKEKLSRIEKTITTSCQSMRDEIRGLQSIILRRRQSTSVSDASALRALQSKLDSLRSEVSAFKPLLTELNSKSENHTSRELQLENELASVQQRYNAIQTLLGEVQLINEVDLRHLADSFEFLKQMVPWRMNFINERVLQFIFGKSAMLEVELTPATDAKRYIMMLTWKSTHGGDWAGLDNLLSLVDMQKWQDQLPLTMDKLTLVLQDVSNFFSKFNALEKDILPHFEKFKFRLRHTSPTELTVESEVVALATMRKIQFTWFIQRNDVLHRDWRSWKMSYACQYGDINADFIKDSLGKNRSKSLTEFLSNVMHVK